MNKKLIGTIILVVTTVGLIGAIIYFNALLSDKGPGAVTQIKKTKASAITYHKFLALNTAPPASGSSSTGASQSDSASQTSSYSSQTSSSLSSSSSLPLVITPTTFTPFRPVTPQTSSVSGINSSAAAVGGSPSPTGTGSTLPAVSPTLIAYRPVTPTLIPVADTGGDTMSESSSSVSSSKSSSSKSVVPTKVIPTPVGADKQLPETGWVQVSMIFFIVAATTVFISFLF